MTGSFILDYYLLVLLASIGLFQLIAARKGFRGLLFFRRPSTSAGLGLALLCGAFAAFFLSEPRNVPDSHLGLNGNEQFAYFFAGIGTGLAFTLVAASLRNRRLGAGLTAAPSGLDALREANYLRAFCRTAGPLLLRVRLWIQGGQKRAAARNLVLHARPAGDVRRRRSISPPVVAEVVNRDRRASAVRRWMRSWG